MQAHSFQQPVAVGCEMVPPVRVRIVCISMCARAHTRAGAHACYSCVVRESASVGVSAFCVPLDHAAEDEARVCSREGAIDGEESEIAAPVRETIANLGTVSF